MSHFEERLAEIRRENMAKIRRAHPQLSGLDLERPAYLSHVRRARRRRVLEDLRRESDQCMRQGAIVEPHSALWALARLAQRLRRRSVTFCGVRFPVTYSVWRGAVRDPETNEALVLFVAPCH
jgi:glycine/D-amino acid oxidase-like deaminating enzyme